MGAVRTGLGAGFIAVVGATATLAAMRPTVARGDALADLVFEDSPHVATTCDDGVPITTTGATFHCHAVGTDGSTADYRVTLDAAGRFATTLESSTPPRLTLPDELLNDPK